MDFIKSSTKHARLCCPNHNHLVEWNIDSPGRGPGEIVHLLLDFLCVPRPRLPGDVPNTCNQRVNIRFAVLDAQAHPDDARQIDLRQQGHDQALKVAPAGE